MRSHSFLDDGRKTSRPRTPKKTLRSQINHYRQRETLYESPPKASTSSASAVSERATASAESPEASSVLNMVRYAINKNSSRLESLRKFCLPRFDQGRARRASPIASPRARIETQNLRDGLASTKPLLSTRGRTAKSFVVPRPLPQQFDQPLSILLFNPVRKIFEIVQVHFVRDTSIGDTLSKARAAASDGMLSGQKYVSLCNCKLELSAPMLPVSLLVDTTLDRSPDRRPSRSEKRKRMEERLLVAVPAGSSAKGSQHIRRVLWKHPRVQRLWKRSDPFSHPDESDADDDDEDLLNAADLVVDRKQRVKPAPALSSQIHKRRNARYQFLDDNDQTSRGSVASLDAA
jgi:hypothetical protein